MKNITNVSIGEICNAHVAHADWSDDGALDESCTKLAKLAATAVDSPKTGKSVTMPPELKPELYPDFMGKGELQSYKSNKILGKLYREIKHVTPSPELQTQPSYIPYDENLQVNEAETFLNDAWGSKLAYDRQLNGLLGQYKVAREEELVTGHIWSMPKQHGGEMKERIKHVYGSLRKEFRKVFDHLGPNFEQISEEERNVMYERKASAWYQVTYNPTWVKKSLGLQEPDRDGEAVNLSFPWIAADYLARIKIKRRGAGDGKSQKPNNSLGQYLADRM